LYKDYDYGAFGVQVDSDGSMRYTDVGDALFEDTDTNPWRYCGEYFDVETGTIYLRARYYNPALGRFLAEDTHWNIGNMVYGDNPVRIGERRDVLGLNIYTHMPSIAAIRQSSNLYVYCGNNPLRYVDPSGRSWTSTMWWLPGADVALPIGDILYGIGVAAELVLKVMENADRAKTKADKSMTSFPAPDILSHTSTRAIIRMQTITITQAQTLSKAKYDDYSPIIIYRLGSGNGTNLTPREKDLNGLSYLLTMPENGPFTMIYMDAINGTGILAAIQDGKNHVSVVPTDMSKMQEWMDSRPTANQDPHYYTKILQSLSFKVM